VLKESLWRKKTRSAGHAGYCESWMCIAEHNHTHDLLIGTWCIENRRPLLHNDSDFHPMARHLGLIEVPATA
jgi:predicted nucleic acid-binding protein